MRTTGIIRGVHDAREASAGDKFSAMLSPLHFGFYASPIVKWLYVIGGFAPAILVLGGTALWFLRTRRTRRMEVPLTVVTSAATTGGNLHPSFSEELSPSAGRREKPVGSLQIGNRR